MAATGVGPQALRMVFAEGALLQQDTVSIVEYEDRERSVQKALLMSL
jgi:hypothetical protein